MGSQWSQVVKDQEQKKPSLAEYTKCQSAVFVYSIGATVTTTGVTFAILQHKSFKALDLKYKCLISGLLGAGSAWYMAAVRSKFCQQLWIAMDEEERYELRDQFRNRSMRSKVLEDQKNAEMFEKERKSKAEKEN